MPEMQQGHLYQHGQARVIALQSGRAGRVAVIAPDHGHAPIQSIHHAKAEDLKALPMRYFHGETPK